MKVFIALKLWLCQDPNPSIAGVVIGNAPGNPRMAVLVVETRLPTPPVLMQKILEAFTARLRGAIRQIGPTEIPTFPADANLGYTKLGGLAGQDGGPDVVIELPTDADEPQPGKIHAFFENGEDLFDWLDDWRAADPVKADLSTARVSGNFKLTISIPTEACGLVEQEAEQNGAD